MKPFLALLITLSLNASSLSWRGDYEKAHQEALSQNKSILVLLVEKNSQTTSKIIQKTFMNQQYIEFIKKNFISILVTRDQKESYPIELLYTLEYPALFFLDKYELYSCPPSSGEISANSLAKKLKECF